MGRWQGLKEIQCLAQNRCSMNVYRSPGSLGPHQSQDHIYISLSVSQPCPSQG